MQKLSIYGEDKSKTIYDSKSIYVINNSMHNIFSNFACDRSTQDIWQNSLYLFNSLLRRQLNKLNILVYVLK